MPDEPSADQTKEAKKQAKAEAKALKKLAKAEEARATNADSPSGSAPAYNNNADGLSPAERSARAAEKKISLERWRTIFAAIGALAALGTLLVYRGC